ncbi:MAG: transcriptional repressor [Planctomycetia bacterium]|nr:transcriptional repressor [Planctomycetia bacterium]
MTKSNPQFQDFKQMCVQHHLAATVQRFAVYETLRMMLNHPTADMIYEKLHAEYPKVSRMSVYRILDSFAQRRIIRRLNHPGSATHYDVFMHPHHHLICIKCGTVYDIEPSCAENCVIPHDNIPEGFQVLDFTVDFQGICPDCMKSEMEEEEE